MSGTPAIHGTHHSGKLPLSQTSASGFFTQAGGSDLHKGQIFYLPPSCLATPLLTSMSSVVLSCWGSSKSNVQVSKGARNWMEPEPRVRASGLAQKGVCLRAYGGPLCDFPLQNANLFQPPLPMSPSVCYPAMGLLLGAG